MKKTRILFLCGLLISVVQVGFTQVRYLKAVGGMGNEEAKRMIQTSDGNYVAVGYFYCVGYTNSWRKAGTTTQGDIFLVKIEPDGDVAWAKILESQPSRPIIPTLELPLPPVKPRVW